MTTTAWANLPNAASIDRVLDALKTPFAIQLADIWSVDRDAAWDTARLAVWGTARDKAWDAAMNAIRDAAYDAILALVAYDDSAKFLDMPSDQLRLMSSPVAVLLLPMAVLFEQIRKLEDVS